tara:strand:+ start:4945 stop:5559 length:615 start_codon:yes stop_codon:yes gene_type:complete
MNLKSEVTSYKGKICSQSTDFVWGDYVSDEAVDEVMNFFDTQTFLPYHKGQLMAEGNITVNKNFKDSEDLHVPWQAAIRHLETYVWALQGVLDKYMEKFPFCELSDFHIVEPLSIQRYQKGGGFKVWHTERSNCLPNNVFRHLVFMTYLNDVPDGGTEWYHQDLYVPAKRGYTVIWPSDWTHHHRGRVSNTAVKTIITGWFTFV